MKMHEVELHLDCGDVVKMKIKESEDWSEIEKGTRALLCLINDNKYVVEIIEACHDEGVFFKIMGEERKFHFDSNVVASIYPEVKDLKK